MGRHISISILCFAGYFLFQITFSQYFNSGWSSCQSSALYLYGSCWVGGCPRNTTFVPGRSYCEVYTNFYSTAFSRCAVNLPCCFWRGTCRSACFEGERNLGVQTECGDRASQCCAPAINAGASGNGRDQQKVSTLQGPCGASAVVNPFILGGSLANPTDWPWVVRLVIRNKSRGICSGVLVDDDTVLTVAHCVNEINANDLQVIIGDFDITQVDPGEDVVPVSSIEIADNYVSGSRGNDLAVLKLRRRVEFTRTKVPACLPDPEIPLLGQEDSQFSECFIAGWGVTETDQVSNQLRTVKVSLLDLVTCETIMSAATADFRPLPTDILCTDPSATGGDACLFDDGGMLSCIDANDRWSLVGLVSQYSCGSLPTIYTRVDNYTRAILDRL